MRFSRLPVQALCDSRLSARDLRVLGALYAHDNGEGVCWPSRETIAEMTGLRTGRVSESTTRLEGYGWVRKEGKGGRAASCRYFLTVPELGTVSDGETVPEEGTVIGETVPEPGTVIDAETVPEPGKTVPEPGTKTVPPVGYTHVTDHEQTNGIDQSPSVGRKTKAPKSFTVTDDMRTYAASKGISDPKRLQDVTEHFLDHHRKKGDKFDDWVAAWRTWIRNEVKWKGEDGKPPPEPTKQAQSPPKRKPQNDDFDNRTYASTPLEDIDWLTGT